MTDTAKKKLAIDLDEIERQLRQGAPQHHAPKNDPLAELARIVGQDDPFRAILGGDKPSAQARRVDPELDDIFAAPRQAAQPTHHADPSHGHDYGREAQQPHSFDEYLAEAGDPRYAQHPQQGQYADDIYADPRRAGDGYAHDGYAHEAYPQDAYAQPEAYAQHDAYAPQPEWQDAGNYQDPAHHYADGDHGDVYPDHAAYAAPERPRRQSRKGVLTVGAVLGVAVLGVASALVFSGGGSTNVGGEPPLVEASSEPLKIAPQNPDGVVIPNQNKQIYERATDEETQVVDREEQPLDIREVAREAPRVVLPPPAGSPARAEEDPINQVLAGIQPQGLQAPAAVSDAVSALGEPRRVRTVSVRPDGTIIGSEPRRQVAQAQPANNEQRTISDLAAAQPFAPEATPAAVPQVVAESQPAAPVAQAVEQPRPAPEPVQQAQPAPAPAAPAPAAAPTPPAAPMALTGAQQPQPARQEAPQQVASIPSQAEAPAQTGGYAVQLAIRDTEERARQAFAQYQTRYAGIIGNVDPIVRRAEVNGNTVYRIRVGPYALGEANSICERIKGTGGDCFVARN